MTQLTERHLEKLASEVVDGFFQGDTPMTEGVIKIAERENFNPEQIKRLVEAANNMAFQRKFNEAEDPDRMAATEFQTADPNAAIQKLIGAAKEVMNAVEQQQGGCPMMADDLTKDLPTTRPDAPQLNMAGPEDNLNKVSEPQVRGHIMILKLRKTAEVFKTQEYQQRINLTDQFQKLATLFTRLDGPVFEEFEKDAFYHWGPRAAPHLQLLRQSLRKEAAEYDHDMMIKIARVVNTDAPEMRLLSSIITCSDAVTQLRQGMYKTAQYLESLHG